MSKLLVGVVAEESIGLARWTHDSRSSTRCTSSVRVWSIWPCSQTEILRGTFHPGRALVQRMHASGEPVATNAGTLGVGRATACRLLAEDAGSSDVSS